MTSYVFSSCSFGMKVTGELKEFQLAVRAGDLNTISSLLNKDKSLSDAILDRNGWRAIHYASFSGNIGIVEQLLLNCANVNSKTTQNHMTALHLSCLKGHQSVTSLLIRHKANVDQRADLEWAPIHLAATNGFDGCIRILLQHQANVNANRPPLGTALHLAAHGKHESCIPVLLEHKANPYALNGLHQTPVEVSKLPNITLRLQNTMNRNPPSYYTKQVLEEEKPNRRVAPTRKHTNPTAVPAKLLEGRPRNHTTPIKPKAFGLPKPKGKFHFPPPSDPAPPPPQTEEISNPPPSIKKQEELNSSGARSSVKILFSRKSVFMDPQAYMEYLEEEEEEQEEEEEEEEEEEVAQQLSEDDLFLRDCSEQCEWFMVAYNRRREKVIVQLYQALYPKYCELRKRNKETAIEGAEGIISKMKSALRECEETYGDILPCVDVDDLESESSEEGEWECC